MSEPTSDTNQVVDQETGADQAVESTVNEEQDGGTSASTGGVADGDTATSVLPSAEQIEGELAAQQGEEPAANPATEEAKKNPMKISLTSLLSDVSGPSESDLNLLNGVTDSPNKEDLVFPQAKWSRIGRPGFSYERYTDPKSIGNKGTWPQTVRYTRIGTPRFSLTRREGNSVDLSAVVIPLRAMLEGLEERLDTHVWDADAIENAVNNLETSLTKFESALYVSQPGRIFFIQVRGFIKEMRRLIHDLDDEEMYPDIGADEVAIRIEVALRNSQRLRAVTENLPLNKLRSYKDPLPNRTIKTAR
eukprot:TRINITY_DN33428_c0_g1_i1.p1 TRINITY_DN33428_c0_g1~~TRINITY_DN33428_c0_g1_i1.p1  ORF type:complete len:305 (-),score=44.18 TRINITY_DN33428_c0_g1_i1:80-994(-)